MSASSLPMAGDVASDGALPVGAGDLISSVFAAQLHQNVDQLLTQAREHEAAAATAAATPAGLGAHSTAMEADAPFDQQDDWRQTSAFQPSDSSAAAAAAAPSAVSPLTIAQLQAQRAQSMQARAGAAAPPRIFPGASPVPLAVSFGGSSAAASRPIFAGKWGTEATRKSHPTGEKVTLASATHALNQAGALKTYKPDAVLRTTGAAMARLSMQELETMLTSQQAALANAKLCAALPDGGELLRRRVSEVQSALDTKKRQLEAELTSVEQMMQEVQIDGGASGEDGTATTEADAAPAADVASAVSSTTVRPYSIQPCALVGRGSAAAAASISLANMHARIAESVARTSNSGFRTNRPPPPILSMAEATALIQQKDHEWHTTIMLDAERAFGVDQAKSIEQQQYRDTKSMFDDEEDNADDDGHSAAKQSDDSEGEDD